MYRARRIIPNALAAISLLVCGGAMVLWIRSPAVFDRVAWTDRAGRYWEVTTLWGDVALVRVDICPAIVPVRWESFALRNALRGKTFRPIADCVNYDRDTHFFPMMDPWGRGFSVQKGYCERAPYFKRQGKSDLESAFWFTPFTRWTMPLWFPAILGAAFPLYRVGRRWHRRRLQSVAPGRPPRRILHLAPSLLLLAILLLWWRGHWAMDRVAWRGRNSTRYLSTCCGMIVFEIGPSMERRFNEAFSASVATATPTTLPFSDILTSPNWNNTYRRSISRVQGLRIERFTFEPDPWDLSRDDVPLTFDLDFTLGRVNRFGFYHDAQSRPTVIIPFWLLAVLAAIIPLRQLFRAMQRRRRIQSNHCAICGYDLRASPQRCPECGEAVACVSLPKANLRR